VTHQLLRCLGCGALGVLLYDNSTWPTELPTEGVFSEARAWVLGRGWVGEAGTFDSNAGSIHVYGSRGSLRIFHYANKLYLNANGAQREVRLPAGTTPSHFGSQLETFLTGIARGVPPAVSATDGIRSVGALLAVYESERLGSWQDLESSLR
jgi:predicted dehydrogenase